MITTVRARSNRLHVLNIFAAFRRAVNTIPGSTCGGVTLHGATFDVRQVGAIPFPGGRGHQPGRLADARCLYASGRRVRKLRRFRPGNVTECRVARLSAFGPCPKSSTLVALI